MHISQNSDMKKILIVVLLILAAALAWFVWGRSEGSSIPGGKRYTNSDYAFTLDYPKGYELTERIVSEPVEHTSITIIDKDDLPPPENGEGPTAITLDIYALNGFSSLEQWIQANPVSNFALGPQTMATTTVNSRLAYTYEWDGLYRGKTTAFMHNGNVFLASVTYLEPTDPIVTDYQQVLSSILLK